jgi:hypothetical protein
LNITGSALLYIEFKEALKYREHLDLNITGAALLSIESREV